MDSSDSSSSYESESGLIPYLLSSSEESEGNGSGSSPQKVPMKRRYPSTLEDCSSDDSDEESSPASQIRKMRHSVGSLPGTSSKDVNATKNVLPEVQNCRHSCSVCDEEYNSSSRTPLCLPCGHTFCLACLKGVETAGSKLCPVCRGEFGVESTAQLKPCYQLVPGNDLRTPIKELTKNSKIPGLSEGAVWEVKCHKQLVKVVDALTSSSVRPRTVALVVDKGFGGTLQQMTTFLNVLRRTNCSISLVLLDSFLDPHKAREDRDEQYLKALVNGRCRLTEFRGFPNRHVLKCLENTQSLQSFGVSLSDASDLRTLVLALDKNYMKNLKELHIAVSKILILSTLKQKVHAVKKAVVHFCDTDDEYIKLIPRFLETIFTMNSGYTLRLHRCRITLKGADALIGIMRDFGMETAFVEAVTLSHNEKHIVDSRCKKFNCQIDWIRPKKVSQ